MTARCCGHHRALTTTALALMLLPAGAAEPTAHTPPGHTLRVNASALLPMPPLENKIQLPMRDLIGVDGCHVEGRMLPGASNRTMCPSRDAADALPARFGCNVTYVTMLLERSTPRRWFFEHVSRRLNPSQIAIAAVDGKSRGRRGDDSEPLLDAWRALGVRFVSNFQHQKGSRGALACTLTHLYTLKWQVERRIPYMVRLEDDTTYADFPTFEGIVCALARARRLVSSETGASKLGSDDEIGPRPWSIYFLNLGEAHLTSLTGAQSILWVYCKYGIVSNVDMTVISALPSQHLDLKAFKVLELSSPVGRGGNIRDAAFDLQHHALRNESAGWPMPAWCTRIEQQLRDAGQLPRLPSLSTFVRRANMS